METLTLDKLTVEDCRAYLYGQFIISPREPAMAEALHKLTVNDYDNICRHITGHAITESMERNNYDMTDVRLNRKARDFYKTR